VTDQALDDYFREAASWDADRTLQAIRRARVACTVASAGWLCAVMAVITLLLLMPLKTVEPYVIRVDNSTGIVDVVPMYEGHAEMGETVARYLLTHYITICEGFNYSTAERDYEECGAYHSAKRNQEWYALWTQGNPNSPLNRYKDGTTVRAQITAVVFFKRANGLSEIAQVRYIKGTRPPGSAEKITHWIATIEYAYVTPSRDPKARQWNPLGFRVTDFQAEAESVADTSVLSAPTS
jgi:type IV secretion system protein VirB8